MLTYLPTEHEEPDSLYSPVSYIVLTHVHRTYYRYMNIPAAPPIGVSFRTATIMLYYVRNLSSRSMTAFDVRPSE